MFFMDIGIEFLYSAYLFKGVHKDSLYICNIFYIKMKKCFFVKTPKTRSAKRNVALHYYYGFLQKYPTTICKELIVSWSA